LCKTDIVKNALYWVGQGALGLSLWNQGNSGPKHFGTADLEHSSVEIIWKTERICRETLQLGGLMEMDQI
jgi:hypothetical protein